MPWAATQRHCDLWDGEKSLVTMKTAEGMGHRRRDAGENVSMLKEGKSRREQPPGPVSGTPVLGISWLGEQTERSLRREAVLRVSCGVGGGGYTWCLLGSSDFCTDDSLRIIMSCWGFFSFFLSVSRNSRDLTFPLYHVA